MDADKNKSIDLLLIGVNDIDDEGHQAPPVGIALLKAIVQSHGYRVKTIDGAVNPLTTPHLITLLDTYHPKVIGLSATAYYVDSLKQIIRTIRSISIEIPIVVGGYCSLISKLLQIIGADVVCLGDGDEIFPELMEFYLSPQKNHDKTLASIRGIEFRVKDPITLAEQFIKTSPRPLLHDLSNLPFPDYSDFNFSEYQKSKWLPFYAQRGCYNHCTFCDIIPFYGEQRIRSMNPQRVIDFLIYGKQTLGFSLFNFTDDDFLSSQSFLSGLADLLEQSSQLNDIKISFQTRAVDVIRFRLLLLRMKQWIFTIELGIESWVDSQLQRFQKNTNSSQNHDALRILRDLDIPVLNYYLFLDDKMTIEELRSNVHTVLNLPPVLVQGFQAPLPELIVNYEYSTLCDLTGNSTVEKIPFLDVFDYVLEQTSDIKKAIFLYKSLKKSIEEMNCSDKKSSESACELILGLGRAVFPLTENLCRERLTLALKFSEDTYNGKIKFDRLHSKKMDKLLKPYMIKLSNLLASFQHLGVSFDEMND